MSAPSHYMNENGAFPYSRPTAREGAGSAPAAANKLRYAAKDQNEHANFNQ